MQYSHYQLAIFDWIDNGRGNAIVDAVAGSGKSTTLVAAAKLVKGQCLFLAFNKHIVETLIGKLAGTAMTASTIHSLGLKTVSQALGRVTVDSNKYRGICQSLTNRDREAASRLLVIVDTVRCRLCSVSEACDEKDFDYSPKDETLVRLALAEGVRQAKQGNIDFTDMIWLPYELNLQPSKYDWLFIDEVQDLNAAQQSLVLKAIKPTGRVLAVGDPRQAIMGFAGADTNSFWTMQAALNAVVLPLSVCYRCPSSHVALAKELVPNIEAAPNAFQGEIAYVTEDGFFQQVRHNDMVLCRLTAPLITTCLELIGLGKKARVRGRAIGEGLIKLVDQVNKTQPVDFIGALADYVGTRVIKLSAKEGNELKIETLLDQEAALVTVYQSREFSSIEDFKMYLGSLFSEENEGITLSTVHRAKGLEAQRVFILQPHKLPLRYPKQSAEQLEQEFNLKYVALTRSKQYLAFVGK